jgi:importin-7
MIGKALSAAARQFLPEGFRGITSLVNPISSNHNREYPCISQVCEILAYFTYFANPITPRLWALWPTLEQSLTATSWGPDYAENIIVPLDNFISRAPDVFCSSTAPNYRESVFRMVKHLFTDDKSESEIKPIAKLLDIVLLNCRGRVDEWVWPYCELVLHRVAHASDPGAFFPLPYL